MAEILRINPGPRMSQAVVHDRIVYTAGQVDGRAADAAGQTANILAQIDDLLTQAGSDRSHLLCVNIWLADIASFEAMNAVWERWIDPANPPARATVQAKLAAPQYLVEIAAVAALA